MRVTWADCSWGHLSQWSFFVVLLHQNCTAGHWVKPCLVARHIATANKFFWFVVWDMSTTVDQTYRVWSWMLCSNVLFLLVYKRVGGAVASWLVRLSPDRAIQVRTLAGDIVLCSWARHLTLTVPLSTQVWVPAKLMLGVVLRWTGIPSRGQ